MTDPFTDVADELMSRSTDLGASAETAAAPPPVIGNAKTKKHVCPYCGAVTAVAEKPTGPCPKCNMEDTPATRAATKARIGPWYVLQTRNPSAPGMKWATLLSLVSKGQVTPRSVVRGPTTHQLWKFAAHVKGLSREFNLCYSCGAEVERASNQCPQCDRLQEPPVNPDALLESRDMGIRAPVQREIKPALAGPQPTDLVVAGPAVTPEVPGQMRPREDGILSAKELATAFQLDFHPQAGEESAEPVAGRKRSPATILAVLLLLAVIAGAVVLYLNPTYREKAYGWASSTVTSIKNSVSSSNKPPQKMTWENSPPPKADDATPAPQPQTTADQTTPTNQTTATPTDITSQATATPSAADQTQNQTPQPAVTPTITTPQPEVTQAPEPKVMPPAETHTTPPPPPQKEDVKPAPAPVVSASTPLQDKLKADLEAPIPADLDAQRALGKRLYNGAIDLESQLDYSLSIPCYEKIKQLDPAARPSSDGAIEMRIRVAKAQVAGQ
jgi:rubrerythrin